MFILLKNNSESIIYPSKNRLIIMIDLSYNDYEIDK